MKKRFKQLLAAVLAMTMLLMTALPVSAATTKKDTLTYIRTADNLFWWYYMQDDSASSRSIKEGTLATARFKNRLIKYPNGSKLIGKPTSSNKKVLTAASYYGNINLTVKKAGKAVVTYSVKDYDTNKTVKVQDTYKIYDYKNPIQSFKIGKTQLASKFNDTPFCPITKNLKGKLSVSVKKGWKLVTIRQHRNTLALDGMMSKNYTRLSRGKNASIALSKKYYTTGSIEVIVYNTAQKYYTSVVLGQTHEGSFSDNVQ